MPPKSSLDKSKASGPVPTEQEKKDMTDCWQIFEPVVVRILRIQPVSGMEWAKVVNLIYAKKRLFQLHLALFKQHLVESFKVYLSGLASEESKLSPERQVEHFGECWNVWFKSSKMLTNLFLYIQRYGEGFNISSTMNELWKTHMFSKECKENLVGVVCGIIDEYRHDNPAKVDLVPALVSSLRHMDSIADPVPVENKNAPKYINSSMSSRPAQGPSSAKRLDKELQEDVLKHTRTYCAEESSRLEEKTPADAIKYVKDICDRERRLAVDFLCCENTSDLDKVLNEVLIKNHISYFFSGFKDVVPGNVELGNAIMELYKRVSMLQQLLDGYFDIIKASIMHGFEENVKEASTPAKFVEIAYREYNRFHEYSLAAFPNNHEFSEYCDKAFTDAFNDNAVVSQNPMRKDLAEISKHSVVAKLLASYVNMLLTRQKTRLSAPELEEEEKKLIILYIFLKDKESFQVQYKSNLARRLLHGETIGDDFETVFLEKLKKTGIVEDFMKATAMLNDMASRANMTTSFGEHLKKLGEKTIRVDPLLCSVNWPVTVRPQAFQISKRMDFIFQSFKDFYAKNSVKKTVILLHQYGKGELSFYTSKEEYILSGSEYQLVLLPMITKDGVTLQHLMDETNLTLDEIKYQLAFLIRHSFIVGKNAEGSPEVNREDDKTWLATTTLTPNAGFKNKMKKIVLSLSKTDKEAARKAAAGGEGGGLGKAEATSEEEAQKIFDDHVVRSECIIVRVMKTRKVSTDTEVFSETAKLLKKYFPLNERVFKKAREKLIDEEILRRKSKTELEYLA